MTEKVILVYMWYSIVREMECETVEDAKIEAFDMINSNSASPQEIKTIDGHVLMTKAAIDEYYCKTP